MRTLSESEMGTCFLSALSLLGRGGYSLHARFYPYASLKSTVKVNRAKQSVSVRVSDGFAAGSREAVTGLALLLFSKAFERHLPGELGPYLDSYYAEFNKQAAFNLSDSLRRARGRKRKSTAGGRFFDLGEVMERVLGDYPELFDGVERPSIHWSRKHSRRRLAFYDPAFNSVVVSRRFDSASTPRFVLEYLVFHELLHARHDAEFSDSRRRVHPRPFKADEKRFARLKEAENFLQGLR